MKRLFLAGGTFLVCFFTMYVTFLIGSIAITMAADLNNSDSFSVGPAWFQIYLFTRYQSGHTGTMQFGAIVIALMLAAVVTAFRWRGSQRSASR